MLLNTNSESKTWLKSQPTTEPASLQLLIALEPITFILDYIIILCGP